jgi:hypothetical protein
VSRAGQRARLDRLLEKIGPRIERVRVAGAGTAEELSGPEPPFIIDELTGRRIYVSPNTLGMFEAKKEEAASPDPSSSPPRLPTGASCLAPQYLD